MEPKEIFSISKEHSIEWGESTWEPKCKAIRNRYNTKNNKFNVAASSEVSWDDFVTMINESLERGYFSKAELLDIKVRVEDKLSK